MTSAPGAVKTLALTSLAMLAFAANSILCRLALQQPLIDAASFGAIRLASGALMLALIVRWRQPRREPVKADWLAAATLFLYVACFSFAYLTLSAGTGALTLFGAVQITMFVVGLRVGERFSPLSWFGVALAAAGLVYLVSPGLSAPAPEGAALMALAGVAWGIYSLRGRGVADPLRSTAGNFVRAVPFALAVSIAFLADFHAAPAGVALAVISGAVTSGIGYAIWYAALRGLNATRAATVQLSVPVIAALGGVLLLSEPITFRLLASSAATLGGIALVLSQRAARVRPA
jgi:drug/metabolite transporter (DMT)-like permease